jgi:hypothetical protein
MLRRFLPAYIKKPIKAAIRRRQIDSAIREMERFGRAEIERLARVWANEGFAADLEYLGALVNLARSTSGEILECGSGLTTIILGKLRKPVTTLENHPEWYRNYVLFWNAINYIPCACTTFPFDITQASIGMMLLCLRSRLVSWSATVSLVRPTVDVTAYCQSCIPIYEARRFSLMIPIAGENSRHLSAGLKNSV